MTMILRVAVRSVTADTETLFGERKANLVHHVEHTHTHLFRHQPADKIALQPE